MSDLRRLIARMDQLNEADPRNSRGLDVPPLEGGSTGAGGAAPSVKSGPLGTTIYTSPPPRVTPAGATPKLPANVETPAVLRNPKQTPSTSTPASLDKPKVTVKPGETMDQALQRTRIEQEFGQFLKGQRWRFIHKDRDSQ